jgi:DNA-directed RNA polymerase I subunit RPA1
MTIRGRFFTRSEYQQHVYSALVDFPGKIKTFPPAILKPEPLWSGKQIISTIIVNLTPTDKVPPTLYSSAKIKDQGREAPNSDKILLKNLAFIVRMLAQKLTVNAKQRSTLHKFLLQVFQWLFIKH